MQFFNIISKNIGIKVLLICVMLDTIFGILRAIKQRKLNSNIGIDGLIRKFGMMISVLFFIAIDYLVNLNLIFFIPEDIRTFIGVESIGISGLFVYLFIMYEMLSILKNMVLCDLPIPKKMQTLLKEFFVKYTDEIQEEKKEGKKKNGKTKTE